jgi:hypothetical protein
MKLTAIIAAVWLTLSVITVGLINLTKKWYQR